MNNTYNLKVNISYDEAYLPSPRHRNLRYRTKEETILVPIRRVRKDEVRLAFTLSDYGHKSQYQTKIVMYDGKLYIPSPKAGRPAASGKKRSRNVGNPSLICSTLHITGTRIWIPVRLSLCASPIRLPESSP